MSVSKYEKIISEIKGGADKYLNSQIEMLKEFSSFDSETHFLQGNRKAVDIARRHLEALCPEFEEIYYENVGTHLIAYINKGAKGGRIIVNAHLDTVFPVGFAEKHPPRLEKDRLYGLGVIDCKGGVAVSAYALRILNELDLMPDIEIDLVYTCDEEQGSVTGQEVYSKIAPGALAAFIFEPGYKKDGAIPILTSRQGVILGNLDIYGVEAHAGSDYSKGVSANKELAHKILELYSLNDNEKGIFYNAAPVSGGRPNGVVSGSANMQFCVAGIPDDVSYRECEQKLDILGKQPQNQRCRLELSYRMLFPPQPPTEKAAGIYKKVEKAASLLGLKTKEDGVNKTGEDIYAATDANYIAALGVPALDGFGPQGEGMHTTDEYVYIPSIKEKTELFALLLALYH